MQQEVSGYSLAHAELRLAAVESALAAVESAAEQVVDSGEEGSELGPSAGYVVAVAVAARRTVASFVVDDFLGFALDEREWRWVADTDCSVDIVHFAGTAVAARGAGLERRWDGIAAVDSFGGSR